MSKGLTIYKGKGKSSIGRLAGTVHPNDSASQISSNAFYEEGTEAGGDATKRIAAAKAKQIGGKQSSISTSSRALVNQNSSSTVGSSLSKASLRSGSGLKVEDITSVVSSSRGNKSKMSSNSKAMAKAMVPLKNKALEAVAESSLSRASSSKSSSKRSSSRSTADKTSSAAANALKAASAQVSTVSKICSTKSSGPSANAASAAQASNVSRASSGSPRQLTIEGPSSQVSRVGSSRSADKDNITKVLALENAAGPGSSVSSSFKAASNRSNNNSTFFSTSTSPSRASGKCRALVPADQTPARVSPLRNEFRAEDLDDDMYSISIHERGPLQKLPNPAEMLKVIMKENPHLDIDEAQAIARNRIATSSAVGRSQIGGHIAPASMVSAAGRSSVSKKSSMKGKEVVRSTGASGISAASSSKSKARVTVQPSTVVSASSAAPAPCSDVSKASSSYGKEMVKGTVSPRSTISAAPRSRSRVFTPVSSSNALVMPSSSTFFTTFKIPESDGDIGAADLLALAQMREQRDLRRAQTLRDLQSQHQSSSTDLACKRMLELEIAKQSLADTQLESQMQEFTLQNTKLGDLMRYAHEDRIAALERAQMSENDRRTSSLIDALRDRTSMEKARYRDKRGDIAKAERRREDERSVEIQKEYERMDHDRTMETVDAFGRLVEASRPRELPQPRKTGVSLAHSQRYRNPQTGGEGVVNMRIHKGCNSNGDGVCPKCGLEYTEHPVKQQGDGSVVTCTGKRIMPGAGGSGSTVSKVGSSHKK